MKVWLVSSCGWPTKGSGAEAVAVAGAVVGAGFLVKSTLFSLPPTLLRKGSMGNFEH